MNINQPLPKELQPFAPLRALTPPRWRLAALAAIAALPPTLLTLRFGPRPDALLVGALLSAVALLLYHAAVYRRALRRLHRHVALAQEGTLEPLPRCSPLTPFLARLINDYNTMITTLRTMFATVEECQGRVLNERNKVDAILQSLPGALLSVADDLRVTTANKQAGELFRAQAEELIGRNLFDLLRLNEADRAVLRDAFLYKQQVRNQEIALRIGERVHWYSLNLAFLTPQEGDMGAVIILQDVTDYRQLQYTVANREKLVAMGQLAAGVAHELNTPLGNILGYSRLIAEPEVAREKLLQFAGVIGDEAKRCSRIVQDLLNYARKDPCNGETCEINALVREVIDSFIACRTQRFGIQIETEMKDDDLWVEGGCGQLDIVLTNLILNAIQALTGISRPVIRICTWNEEGQYAAISVTDNGPGVPEAIRSRIFDPFFTTKEVGEGSGLGLSISQAMLTKRGGFIRYDAEYREGARFILKLPLVTQKEST